MSGWHRSMGRSKLHRQYYDQKRVGSYGGVAALQRVVPAERDVGRWLSMQDAYTLHKPVTRRFKRRCVVVGGPNQQWQADLVDMSRLKQSNNEITFLLYNSPICIVRLSNYFILNKSSYIYTVMIIGVIKYTNAHSTTSANISLNRPAIPSSGNDVTLSGSPSSK